MESQAQGCTERTAIPLLFADSEEFSSMILFQDDNLQKPGPDNFDYFL